MPAWDDFYDFLQKVAKPVNRQVDKVLTPELQMMLQTLPIGAVGEKGLSLAKPWAQKAAPKLWARIPESPAKQATLGRVDSLFNGAFGNNPPMANAPLNVPNLNQAMKQSPSILEWFKNAPAELKPEIVRFLKSAYQIGM